MIHAADQGILEAWLSTHVLEEVERNLRSKAPAALPAFFDLVRVLMGFEPVRVVRPSKRLVTRVAQVVEPKDAPIVAAAIACKSGIPGQLRSPTSPLRGDQD